MANGVIIGNGNIAYHFFPALNEVKGLHINYLFTRSEANFKEGIDEDSVRIISKYDDIPLNTDVIFLMVNDDSINPVTEKLKEYVRDSTLIIHFSGSLDLSAIDRYFKHTGIIWPIQSISSLDMNLDLSKTPLSIAYSDEMTKGLIVKWASHISDHVYFLSPEEKKWIHLSAVFANNFTNHLYVLAEELLNNENLDFELIKPLIKKTAMKALQYPPSKNQTGPAIRNDQDIMNTHLEMIGDTEIREMYKLISESILKKSLK